LKASPGWVEPACAIMREEQILEPAWAEGG